MKVKVIKAFACVADENPATVHPTDYAVGTIVEGFPATVALRNKWGELVADDATAPAKPAGGQAPPVGGEGSQSAPSQPPATPEPAPAPFRARTTKKFTGKDPQGLDCTIARNVIVEGDFGRRLVAEGFATEEPIETK